MHDFFKPIVTELDGIIEALKAAMPTNIALSLNSGNWSYPGVSRKDLLDRAQHLKQNIEAYALQPSPESEAPMANCAERLGFLKNQTIVQIPSQPVPAITAYFLTFDSVENVLAPVLGDPRSKAVQNSQQVQKVSRQVLAIETRLRELNPRAATIEKMVERIENANEAADQLPADLETLSESQKKVSELLKKSEFDRAQIENAWKAIEALSEQMQIREREAKAVLELSERAYSSATSVGLAAAFSERSAALDKSVMAWVSGLVISLLTGTLFGSWQVGKLSEVLANPQASSFAIVINLVLAVLSVGGPIWFSWLSTKQIGQRFRLSEDYAFKASVSRAYEGYRREAASLDPEFQRKLLDSALSRLDEQPLRLVEEGSFGSPWHELLSSDVMKDALKAVPNFATQLTDFATESLTKTKTARERSAANSATSVTPPGEEKAG